VPPTGSWRSSLLKGAIYPFHRVFATLGYVGFVPVAPGTAGTLCALVLVYVLNLPPVLYLALTVLVVVLGTVSSSAVERATGEKDSNCIVIDEFAGYLIAVAFLPKTFGYLAAAFFLFRVLDILKPPPIGGLQRFRGGLGVMVDDVAAGIVTNLILQAWRFQTWI
jgi:phosphatidylglycerophosphatase A